MIIDKEFLKKYDVPGPRYTSYPPVPHFTNEFTEKSYVEEIIKSNDFGTKNISLYIHIPFCNQRCHYCGCNTELKQEESIIKKYLDALKTEIVMLANIVDTKNRQVTQIHWGGGTPNILENKDIDSIMNLIKENFILADNIEIAMECHPHSITEEYLKNLYKSGFNRLSFGIQDFNPKVLELINRLPSKIEAEELVKICKRIGFKGVNFDFIYGLSAQTSESFKKTIKRAIKSSPDRIVTFSYAHVPWIKEEQKILEEFGLPSPDQKMTMMTESLKELTNSGYKFIGMDHYAKTNDDLFKAVSNRKLHRNFQGYCTKDTTGQVYAIGVSGITQLESSYAQNTKDISLYIKSISNNKFAVEKGLILTKENRFRRSVINSIMCNGFLDLDTIYIDSGYSKDESDLLLKDGLDALKEFEADGLVNFSDSLNEFSVTEKGRLVVRNIAMLFDPLLKTKNARYSRTV